MCKFKSTNHSMSTPFKTLTIFSQADGADDLKDAKINKFNLI